MSLSHMWIQSHSTRIQLIMVLALGKANMWRIHNDIGTVEHILMGILYIWYLRLVDLSRGLRKFNQTWSDIYYQLHILPNTKSVSYNPVIYFLSWFTFCCEHTICVIKVATRIGWFDYNTKKDLEYRSNWIMLHWIIIYIHIFQIHGDLSSPQTIASFWKATNNLHYCDNMGGLHDTICLVAYLCQGKHSYDSVVQNQNEM